METRSLSRKAVFLFLPLAGALAFTGWRHIPRSLSIPQVLAAEPTPVTDAATSLTADEIFSRAEKAYGGCQKFRDEGYTLHQDLKNGSSGITSKEHFRIAFERLHRMTLQWRKRHDRFFGDEFTNLVDEHGSIRLDSDLHDETITPSSMAEALEVDHRELRGMVKSLLPEVSHEPSYFRSRPGAQVTGVELVNGHSCFRITWNDPEPPSLEKSALLQWWIDCDSFLLRRTQSDVDFGDRIWRRTTGSSPELEPALTPADFQQIEL